MFPLTSQVSRGLTRAVGLVLALGLLAFALSASGVTGDARADDAPAQVPAPVTRVQDEQAAHAALVTLIERLTVADEAMNRLRVVDNPAEAHQLARAILDQITGPAGRHAGPDALVPGVFPADLADASADPGLALTIFDATDRDDVRREFTDVIIGDETRWRRPVDRWDEIDAVLAAWRPDLNTMPRLDGHLMRVVGWSVLTLRSDSAKEARGYASHGRLHTGLSLEAAQRALAALEAAPVAAP